MKCISLFSGCGGLDLGITRAGFDLLLATDNWHLAKASHQRNFPAVPFILADAANLNGKLLEKHLGKLPDESIDLLAGGPPCPAFSKSRFYRKDKPRALHDPTAQSTLTAFLCVLRDLRPKTFLLENVPGFAYKIHQDALNFVLDTATSLGYQCNYKILNAADFGVPQIRQRFFMVGSLYAKVPFPEPTHADPCNKDLFDTNLPPWVTAGDAISDLDTKEMESDEGHYAGGKYHEHLREIPPGQNYLYFTEKRGHPKPVFKWRSRYWSFLLKLSPDKPAWTIQARRSNNMGPFHWRNRILRIAEIKRLQSFPDSWELSGTTELQWKQVGNAVPPLLARNLAFTIKDHLLKNHALNTNTG